ncbi:MAG: multiprotein-bridging factor 1 family protein [Flammeovirgaceae bacterium]
MQQPELGQQLAALRKQHNLTQEELVEKSHVSVRTIQRIEAGEVIPRLSTVKILWRALGAEYTLKTTTPTTMEITDQHPQHQHQQQMLTAVIAGALYLVFEIALSAMDFAWLSSNANRSESLHWVYGTLTLCMVVSYVFFARGFLLLAKLFENNLLTVASILMILAVAASGLLTVTTFSISMEEAAVPFVILAMVVGICSLTFGIALLRLQDSMGSWAKVAGILEIVMGCALVTVLLFFVALLVLIPATVVEILLLYHGYEYLSKSRTQLA